MPKWRKTTFVVFAREIAAEFQVHFLLLHGVSEQLGTCGNGAHPAPPSRRSRFGWSMFVTRAGVVRSRGVQLYCGVCDYMAVHASRVRLVPIL